MSIRMVLLRFFSKSKCNFWNNSSLRQCIFEAVTSLFGLEPLPYVTPCHLFGQPPFPLGDWHNFWMIHKGHTINGICYFTSLWTAIRRKYWSVFSIWDATRSRKTYFPEQRCLYADIWYHQQWQLKRDQRWKVMSID